MQVDINQIGKGSTIEINKDVYSVINYQHVKPGKGGAFVR
ncbi:MAG: elongation factor P, partial [Candidatus Omnitrophota bacterium]|nr:elongation factor P [Candidatus Omnitrophota bacterium]